MVEASPPPETEEDEETPFFKENEEIVSEDPHGNTPELVEEEEITKRAEFLRSLRDNLLAMKKTERERLLAESESSSNARPKSSKAARRAASDSQTIDPQTLSIRKALVEKLKKEVINQ
ncbi:unnamed protein product [Lepeophtheirus salmonis]|uniref:(salmon louse) hypothetical protein n=2 Tax=Lepeophtheirus salmonis TaxID=72036 RepID=A0A7R8CZW0_LEPSM|nr:unnamed protein product [Lepeophtheirus salmonis]CAF2954084.1 unnamed protein product [Lepeophtheirus salmonis]